MTIKYADWLGENTRTVGSGSVTLAGTILGYASFASLGDCQVYYTIVDGQNKESGIGTITGREMSRAPISVMIGEQFIANSAPLNLTGNAQVYGTINAAFFSSLVLNTDAWVVSLPNDLASKYSPTNKPTPADIGAEVSGAAESAVGAHAVLAGAHSISGVSGLQAALDSKQLKIDGAIGYRNIILNGDKRINQRGFSGVWSSISVGDYGYDRWKKVDATNMSQTIEAGDFIPSATYTLSGTGITTQQLTAPASGNWAITVLQTATNIQLEFGSVATPFEKRHIAAELAMCQRYYCVGEGWFQGYGAAGITIQSYTFFKTTMRTNPTVAIAYVGGGFANVSGSAGITNNPDTQGVRIGDTITVLGNGYARYTFTANAEL